MSRKYIYIIVSCLLILIIISLNVAYNNFNEINVIAEKYVKRILLSSKREKIINNLQSRYPSISRSKIIKLVEERKNDPELIRALARKFAEFFSVEELNFLLEFESSPEGECIIIKQEIFSGEINQKKEQLLYMAKNAFDNNEKPFSAEVLFYDENPDFLEMKNEMIAVSKRIDLNPTDWLRKSFIDKLIDEYPEDRRDAFKTFMEKTPSDELFEDLSINVIMHHLSDDEFKAYYKYRVSDAFLTLARFSRQNSRNKLIDMMNNP